MSFGRKLKMLREERKMFQSELAELLNLAPSSISMYEKDERDPDTSTVKKIAEIFNVSTDYLLGVNDTKEINEPIQIAASMKDGLDISDMGENDKKVIMDLYNLLKSKNKDKSE